MDRLIVVLAVLVVAVIAADRLIPEGVVDPEATTASDQAPASAVATDKRNAIAVMPFRNMSDDPGNQYFSEGISGEIVRALRGVLGEASGMVLPVTAQRPTENLQAYEFYLEGRYWLQNRILFRTEGLHKGIDALHKAIELDPEFAQAHASLAACYVVYDGYATEFEQSRYEDGETQTRATFYAEKALALDESLADAYATLGLVHRDHAKRQSRYLLYRHSEARVRYGIVGERRPGG